MSGRRELVVFLAAGLLLATAVVEELLVAEARRDEAARYGGIVTESQAAGDWDGDGIPDDVDLCPVRPETFNGFQDQDGCPDTVTTTRGS